MVNFGPTVLVVPPFECAWLTGENYLLRGGQGCICFEVKGKFHVNVLHPILLFSLTLLHHSRTGDNDVTVILKPQCGSRRWQHLSASPRAGGGDPASPLGRQSAPPPVEANYTVILGSHRNSCLKIEKDGELCHMASNIPGSKLSATSFTKFWVSFSAGVLAVGTGEPNASSTCCSWTDAEPIPDIQFVGLSAWDKHVGYRNIRVEPQAVQQLTSSAAAAAAAVPPYPHHSADFEPVPTLVELCCIEALRNMVSHNICAVLTVSDAIAPVVDGLRALAVESAAQQLPEIVQEDPHGFTGLTVASLADILQNKSLICGEKELFDALMLWAGGTDAVAKGPLHQPQTDSQRLLCDVESLLPHVRFPLMSLTELAAVERHPLHSRSVLLQELVAEARRGTAPSRAAVSVRADRLVRELSPTEAATSARFQRRSPHGCTQLIYLYDGDYNGVCRHIGTRYGTQKWMNPVVAGLLEVRASSPVARGTDPRALLSGSFLRRNFAGPRRESGGAGLEAWWAIDLGPAHSLECNFYTLRADGSADFLRNWALQGSDDGVSWTDLRRHEEDRMFKLPGQYASWSVAGAAAGRAYRHFRIYLLAPNNEAAANPPRVCLSNIELYGNFYRSSIV